MRTRSVKEVRKELSEVLREVEAGDTTVITRYGTPIAQIVPIDNQLAPRPHLPQRAPRGNAVSDELHNPMPNRAITRHRVAHRTWRCHATLVAMTECRIVRLPLVLSIT